jgi:hypothetical protein
MVENQLEKFYSFVYFDVLLIYVLTREQFKEKTINVPNKNFTSNGSNNLSFLHILSAILEAVCAAPSTREISSVALRKYLSLSKGVLV